MENSEFSISEDEYVRANRLYSKPSRRAMLVYVTLIIIFGLVCIFGPTELIRYVGAGGLAGGVAGYFLSRFVIAPFTTRNQYRSFKAARDSTTVSYDSEGITLASSSRQGKISWDRVFRWREDDEFLLVYEALSVYYIIPKRIGSVAKSIRQELVSNVGNSA